MTFSNIIAQCFYAVIVSKIAYGIHTHSTTTITTTFSLIQME